MRERVTALLAFLGVLWIVWALHQIFPAGIGLYGVIPRNSEGLRGIITAPFLHLSLDHLIANSIPLLILGALILLRGVKELVYVILVTGLISGIGIWLFGAPGTMHFGASGLVFGFISFLLFRAIFDRTLSSVLITVIVALLYGSTLLASFLPAAGVSWSGHLWGFIGGIIAARWRHPRRAYHRYA
ncbi:MAG TPA: rhomboid family intramembrane serine protease [Thermoanaerobaculia bacterium]|jgi:membrane associated rhomboid family serine protease